MKCFSNIIAFPVLTMLSFPMAQTVADTGIIQQDSIVVEEKDLDEVVGEEYVMPVTVEYIAPASLSSVDTVTIKFRAFESPCFGCRQRAEKEREQRSVKGYRSPEKAFFLSFLIPGLGQLYNRHYTRTAVYGCTEAFLIGASIAYYAQGRDKKKDAYQFANEHYDVDKFWEYYNNIGTIIQQRIAADSMMIQNIRQNIVRDSTEFAQDAADKNQQYYISIERNSMVQGWTDCQPKIDIEMMEFDLEPDNHAYVYRPVGEPAWMNDTVWLFHQIDKTGKDTIKSYIWGYSEHQQRYNSMVSDANSDYRIAQGILPFIAVNHLVSALDALISAVAINHRLAGRQSFLERIRLDQQLSVSSLGLRTRLGISVGL
jgi:hypothetical protein